jgi:type III secretion system FlhB-like substrate exporter
MNEVIIKKANKKEVIIKKMRWLGFKMRQVWIISKIVQGSYEELCNFFHIPVL